MNPEMQPLFWRISDTDHSGFEGVSLLMPSSEEGGSVTVFPTDVRFPSNRTSTQPVDVRWSEEDSDLFMMLLDRFIEDNALENEDVDISDQAVQGIVQLVALARFNTPWPSDGLDGRWVNTEREELAVGDLIAINTQYGYPLAIIVALDPSDATCILLEAIVNNDETVMPEQTLLVVSRMDVLPAAFSNADEGEDVTWH